MLKSRLTQICSVRPLP